MVASRSRPAHRLRFGFRPSLESLEGRLLMAGLDVPQLSSRSGAAATLYLDFDGHFESSWGTFSNVTSPAFDRDGDLTSFNDLELSSINEIWTRVAEDFAPFNINVTTVAPASFNHGQTLTVVIGGGWSDWYGTSAKGASFIGGFTSSDPNLVYVFSRDLGPGVPRWVGDQVSHEAGHAFGLLHQSTWTGTTLTAELNSGSGGWTPIMGGSLTANRTTWFNGRTNVSPSSFQDDMAIIGSAANGFGFVADDYADTLATAGQLPIIGSSVNLTGLIRLEGDQDVFKFTTAGGNLSFNLAVAAFGANLDSALELRDANGFVVRIANDTTSGVFSSALSANVAAGTYYLVVRASGGYGNVGQYALTGTVVPAVITSPEVSVVANGADLISGGSFDFGSTLVGTPVAQTFTVQNLGNGNLTLTSLDSASFPAGFSLITDLGATTLTPGETTTFTVQLDALVAGSFTGTIHLLSDDADEGSFDIVLNGVVTEPIITTPEIRVWAGPTELTSGDPVAFGSTTLGTTVTRTFTIQNVGDGDLVLAQLDSNTLQDGFSLVQGFGDTTLQPTAFITFVVQFDATTAGSHSGALHILSNDVDESSFDVLLSGSVTAPDISVFSGSTKLASGDVFSFGAATAGTPLTHTFTIQNTGDGDLIVTGIDSTSLPSGYSLVAGFGTTTIVPGASVILTVQLNAAAAGSYSGTLRLESSDADESPFDIALSGMVTAPKIGVFVGDVKLSSGSAVDFGATQVGGPVTRTITVTNIGDADLVLSPIDPNTLPAGFSLVSDVTFVDSTTLAPGQSTTITLQMDATAAGSLGGIIHVVSNADDEPSFDLTLQGVVNDPAPPPPDVRIIDNGADGFAATGKWQLLYPKGGFEQDIQFANKANKNDNQLSTATWMFAGVAPGLYRVSVSSPTSPSYASDAPFSVLDGTTLLRTVRVNQSKGTGNAKATGVRWNDLGTFSVQGGTLIVQLNNRANGHVIADAVKIERVTSVAETTTPPSGTSQPKSGKGNESGKKPVQQNSNSQRSKPQPKPASHAKKQAKSKNHAPSPRVRHDPDWLDSVASDVAKNRIRT